MNWQKAEEWACQGRVEEDCSKRNVFQYPDGSKSAVFIMDGGAGTQIETPEGATKIMTQLVHCKVLNDTVFCRNCAKKYGFKCPICGAGIKKERDERGYTIE